MLAVTMPCVPSFAVSCARIPARPRASVKTATLLVTILQIFPVDFISPTPWAAANTLRSWPLQYRRGRPHRGNQLLPALSSSNDVLLVVLGVLPGGSRSPPVSPTFVLLFSNFELSNPAIYSSHNARYHFHVARRQRRRPQ